MAKFKTIEFDIFDAKIDEEFAAELPEHSEEDLKQLEENILADGEIRNPFTVWTDPDTGEVILIDGQHRLHIMEAHPEIDFPYTVKEADFDNRWEVIAWMLANCIGHRNLNDIQHKRIIAKYNEAILKARGGDHRSEDFQKSQSGTIENNSDDKSARKQTAEKFGVGKTTVGRAIDLDKGISEGEKESPGFAKEVESGEIKASQEMISNISKVPEEHRSEYVGTLSQIRKNNTAQENKEKREEAQDIYSRYSKSAIDKATNELNGFREDPFGSESEENSTEDPDKVPFEIDTDVLELSRIHSSSEEVERLSPVAFGKLIADTITNMKNGLQVHYQTNQRTLALKDARSRGVTELKKGIDILNDYIDLFENFKEEQ